MDSLVFYKKIARNRLLFSCAWLRWVALVIFAIGSAAVHAASLGAIRIQSTLGQPLNASIVLNGSAQNDLANCVKAKLSSSEGVLITLSQIKVAENVIVLTSHQPIVEPALTISISVGCKTPERRNYQVMLDAPLPSGFSKVPKPKQDDNTGTQRLPDSDNMSIRLQPTLSLSNPASTTNLFSDEEWKAAQSRFAAVLRGEDTYKAKTTAPREVK